MWNLRLTVRSAESAGGQNLFSKPSWNFEEVEGDIDRVRGGGSEHAA